ncbi:hypothetical protein [Achromobacter sp. GbtcB20]|uniref:hypothetical protein n=1 Tax=Achromobacter sp. GbtcB20 TaxID=2824765 RepID=UPI001D0F4AF2|nr:hypothetical protein [Achromobacter sp. GbtcB20]
MIKTIFNNFCYIRAAKPKESTMNAKRTTGFHDLVYFIARPTVVIFAVIVAFGGGYLFQSKAFVQLILVPVGICVAIALLDIIIVIATRLMGFVINPNYRRRVMQTIADTWRGDRP